MTLKQILKARKRSISWLHQELGWDGYWTIQRIANGSREATEQEIKQIQKVLPEWEG